MRIAYNFTPVDWARVSQGTFTSWLAEISTVSGEISVKRASPLHTSSFFSSNLYAAEISPRQASLVDRASPLLVKRP